MQFVRAPDENVYIAPFNLIEIVVSGLFEWWMPKRIYETINDYVMATLYSPLLVVAAYFETRTAHMIRRNRARGEEDDDVVDEWEHMANEVDFEAEGWSKTCESIKPNMDDDPAVLEIQKLRAEVKELKTMIAEIGESFRFGTSQDTKIADSPPQTAKVEDTPTEQIKVEDDESKAEDVKAEESENEDASKTDDDKTEETQEGQSKKNKKKNKKNKGKGVASQDQPGPSAAGGGSES